MGLKEVKPLLVKPPRVVTPQCCVKPDDTDRMRRWRQDRFKKLRPGMDPQKCQRESVVQIDGKYYCANHGGKVALRKWLRGELIDAGKKKC